MDMVLMYLDIAAGLLLRMVVAEALQIMEQKVFASSIIIRKYKKKKNGGSYPPFSSFLTRTPLRYHRVHFHCYFRCE